MKALIQRVLEARVVVDDEMVGEIGPGMLVFLGVVKDDTDSDAEYVVKKLSELRMFEDEKGKMNLSIEDVGGNYLIVSQFTLAARLKKGRRPSFDEAATPELAQRLYEKVVVDLADCHCAVDKPCVQTGVFGAEMEVQLINDGPVTFMLDSRE